MVGASLVAGVSAFSVALVLGGFVMFGANTTCTNWFSCTDSYCAPCRPLWYWFWVHTVGQGCMAGAAAGLAASRPRVRLWTTLGWMGAAGSAGALSWWWVDWWLNGLPAA